MPEAIATTKRKFHRLLDTLTSYANAPVQSAGPTTPLTAREKLEQASERVRKRQRQDGSLSSIESRLTPITPGSSLLRKASSTSTMKQLSKGQSPPNFSPWSQETFLSRLHTFSRVSLWHPKPDGIGEVAWAKRGWQCVEVNTVACDGCGSRVVVDFRIPQRQVGDDDSDNDDTTLEQALVLRYQEEIIAGHTPNCLWRKSGCKDDIYRLQVVRPAVWQPALKARYTTLLAISDSIQHITIRGSADTSQHLREELSPEILPTSDQTTDIQDRALSIALHGWRGSCELKSDLLECDACFQRIGLWMYQPGYHSRAAADDEDEPEASVNVVQMHREYCPWSNADSQQATGTLAGLNASEILFKVIATYLRERRRRTEERPEPSETIEPENDEFVDVPKLSRAEIDQQDRERESRMQKLKRLLTIKRSARS